MALIRPLVGYRSVVETRNYSLDPADLVVNVLTAYDLPDLAATLVPRRLLIVDPRDATGASLGTQAYHVALESYKAANAIGNYRYLERLDGTRISGRLIGQARSRDAAWIKVATTRPFSPTIIMRSPPRSPSSARASAAAATAASHSA